MTAVKPVHPYGGVLRSIALLAGLLLLADSVSQLIQAAGGLEPGSRNWRLVNLRLLFTQVTPLTVGLLLVGQSLVRSVAGWKRAGFLALVLGIGVGVLATVYLLDTRAMLSSLNGPAPGQLRRTIAQVLISSGAFGLALLASGILSLRVKRTA